MEAAMRERIAEALRQATQHHDQRRMNTLRLICVALKDRDAVAQAAGKERLSEAEVLELLVKLVKQRKESARTYEEDGRAELAREERDEIAIIKSLLPAELTDADLARVCARAIADTDAQGLRDIGKAMAELKARYPGQMDFAKAIQIVKERLQ
jgi:uncharacterized protein YqeY